MASQAGIVYKWTNDSQRFLLEHFDTIHNSPSHIYHSALPLSPSSSWLQRHYSAELSYMVKVIKGLPAEWGTCSYTVSLDSSPTTLSCHDNTIAVGCKDGGIVILNAITGSQAGTLPGHIIGVTSLSFSSDGILLVSVSSGDTIKLWDIQTGGVIKTFYPGLVCSASISADCTRIAIRPNDSSTIQLWDTQTGECYYTIQQQSHVSHTCFSPTDPQYLFSISNGEVWQWDTNGTQIRPPFDGEYVSFSSDGTQLASWHKGVAIIRNSDSGEIVAELQVTNKLVRHCCFSPNCRLVAGTIDNTAYVWDITNSDPHLVGTFVGHSRHIDCCAFSSPFSLITGSTADNSVKVWKIGVPPTEPVITDLKSASITSPPIQHISLQAKDGITITSDSDGVVKIWDIFTGLCKASYQTPAKGFRCKDAQLIDGRLICVWHDNSKIHLWDAEKGGLWEADHIYPMLIGEIRILGDRSGIIYLDIGSIKIHSIQTGELVGDMEDEEMFGSLVIDGSRVWAYDHLGYQGWDFGVSGSSPLQLNNIPPQKLHPNGTLLWDVMSSGIRDKAAGRVVFQLSRRLTKPIDAQWNEHYLVFCYPLNHVLVLDFSYFFLQQGSIVN